jgi:hypothetical protein
MKKNLIFACIFVLVGFIGTSSAITVGNTIVDRPNIDGAINVSLIDPTLVFETDGTLNSFSFWQNGQQGDKFATQIYRYAGSADNWTLVYEDIYTLGVTTNNSFTFVTSPFAIQAGDVVGWWFGAGAGVIPYTNTGSDDVEWTNWRTVIITNPAVGNIYSFNTSAWTRSSQKREYSISADYTPTVPELATIDYTPTVPEPATMLLLGLGLMGLAGVRRKIKK